MRAPRFIYRIDKLTEERVPAGTRIRVHKVAYTEAEAKGLIDDTKRLLGQTATVDRLVGAGTGIAQLWVEWDDKAAGGSLMLAGGDEVEVLP